MPIGSFVQGVMSGMNWREGRDARKEARSRDAKRFEWEGAAQDRAFQAWDWQVQDRPVTQQRAAEEWDWRREDRDWKRGDRAETERRRAAAAATAAEARRRAAEDREFLAGQMQGGGAPAPAAAPAPARPAMSVMPAVRDGGAMLTPMGREMLDLLRGGR